jgi:CheY-like chemotaxis protein
MAKILLVEDDNNLREIYEARLQAEGYEIVSAPDGEAALVSAKKELPDLVISDVMMPRISGFEMLDIMRNTEGLKHVKVIMLTALGQAEDKTRGDKLGADKYLVKSQVTLEDIVKAAAELVGGETPAPAPAEAAAETNPAPTSDAATAQPQTQAQQPAPAMPVAQPPAVPTPEPAAPTITATEPMPVAAPPETVPTQATPDMTATTPAAPTPELAAPVSLAPETAQETPPPATSPVPADPQVTQTPAQPPAAPADTTNPAQPPAAPAPDDQIVADAVKDLISGTQGVEDSSPAAPAPATPTAPQAPPVAPPSAQPPPSEQAPQPTQTATPTQPATPAAPPASEPQTSNNDDEDARPKRVIQPLGPDNMPPASADINELAAQEGHALDAVQPPQNNLPHQPGHVISPRPVSPTGEPEDPNKISL